MTLIDMVKRAGLALAAQAVARLRARVAQRLGVADSRDDGVAMPPDVQKRRRGRRDRLADPDLLWPGDW